MAHTLVNTARRWILQPLKPIYDALPFDERTAEGEFNPLYDAEKKAFGGEDSKWWALVPFFIAAPLGRTKRTLPKPNSTSYVNGLRGVACLIVYHQHLSWWHAKWIQTAWGADANNMHFWQLPYFRLLHCGMFMVSVFFVLSGFVLTYSPLKKINSPGKPGSDSALLTSLSSSLFRRPLRLFAPMVIAIMLTSVVNYNMPSFDMGGWADGNPTFPEHFMKMMRIVLPALNVYNWGYYWPRGFAHGWTLQMEYRGSVVVFVLCLLTARLTPTMRKLTLLFSAWYALFFDRWEVFCFIEGMFIAELRFSPIDLPGFRNGPLAVAPAAPAPTLAASTEEDVERGPGQLLQQPTAQPPWWTSRANLCWAGVLAFGLLMGGWPTHGASMAYPWKAFYPFMPSNYSSKGEREPDPAQCYWISIAAGLIVMSLEQLPGAVRGVFDTKPMIYLGEISYAFYLLHQTVMFSLGRWWYSLIERTGLGSNAAFFSEYFVVLGVLLCFSDLFWRGVDENVVKLSRRFAIWCGIQ